MLARIDHVAHGNDERGATTRGLLGSAHRRWVALAVLVALAFSLRAASYFANPRPIGGGGLAAEQAEMARNIVEHDKWFVLNPNAFELIKQRQEREHRLVDFSKIDFTRVDMQTRAFPVVDQMPGVAAVLAALWWPTGSRSYAPIQWLQILLDTAMVLLIYWITYRLTRRHLAALLAALFYAVFPRAIDFAKYPVLDMWAIFFTIACVGAFVWARERPASLRRLVPLGVLTGLGVYFRPFVILLPITLALLATPGGGWKRRLTWIAVPTAIALVLLSPWTIRNYYEFHRFIPTRTGLGQAVFEGVGQGHSDEHSKAYVQQHRPGARYGSPAYDDFLLGGAARAIADHPGFYARLVWHRAQRYLLPCLLVLFVWRRWRSAALVPVAAVAATVFPYLLIGDDRRFYRPAFFAYFILLAMVIDLAFSYLAGSPLASRARARFLRQSAVHAHHSAQPPTGSGR
jgi:4-amino-4-deoxy-L-arabinose transferase-like glycosyltransferase